MKTVLLVRHAKSSWDDPASGDFDRPLAPRGRKAAPRIARYMHDEGLTPELVLCSAALRAQETWALMAPAFDTDIPMELRRDLYHAAPHQLLEALREAPDEAAVVLMVAHSPGMEGLAIGLSGPGSERDAVERLTAKFPTGALAVISFDGDRWGDLGENGGALTRFVCPRDLE
jgi:phosphohistidine phosphatase